jgi:hypothetical protein
MVGKRASASVSSSSKFIEGVPSPILFFGDLIMHLQEYLEDAVNASLDEEHKIAKQGLVLTDPKYKSLVKDFKIQYQSSDQTFSYLVDGASGPKAVQLEYGPPAQSLLRKECMKGSKRLGLSINKRLDKLTGVGGLN